MDTKCVCSFIAFNLLSFLAFTLMSFNLIAGVICFLVALIFGVITFPVSMLIKRGRSAQ